MPTDSIKNICRWEGVGVKNGWSLTLLKNLVFYEQILIVMSDPCLGGSSSSFYNHTRAMSSKARTQVGFLLPTSTRASSHRTLHCTAELDHTVNMSDGTLFLQ